MFIFFIALCVGAFLGVSQPKNTLTRSVNTLQLTTSENGLSLFQGNTGEYFYFSPFQDSLTYGDGKKTGLITNDEVKKGVVKTNSSALNIPSVLETLMNYFTVTSPSMNFTTDKYISYSSRIYSNNLTITRTIGNLKNVKIGQTSMSISFNSSDFVFDKDRNSYNYTDPELTAAFEHTFRTTLTPKTDELYITTPQKTIFIYSPKISGVIAIKALPFQRILIDRNSRVVQVESPVVIKNGTLKNEITVQIFNSPVEALKAI